MTKNFYKKEYSETEWQKVIDKALDLGCTILYSRYGNICVIDSTALENEVMFNAHNDISDSGVRCMWAEHIFNMIENAKNENE